MLVVCVCVCVCATLIGTRTGTRGIAGVRGKPGVATRTTGRAVSFAGEAGVGSTVRTSALIGCTDKHEISGTRSLLTKQVCALLFHIRQS